MNLPPLALQRFGLIPDAPDDRDYSALQLLGMSAASSAPSAVSHADALDFVLHQAAEDCVGCFVSNAVFLRGMVSGVPVSRPSPMAAYTLGRMHQNADAGHPGAPLQDVGSSPRYVMQAARRYGLVAIERWPEEERLAETPIPLDVIGAAMDARVQAYYVAAGPADMIVADLRKALSLGYIPGFGSPVDRSYLVLRGPDWTGYDAADHAGYHQQTIVGYDDAREAFLVLNSWGPDWGADGFVWVPYRWVGGEHCFGRYILASGPQESPR